jgi:hypothetical protein
MKESKGTVTEDTDSVMYRTMAKNSGASNNSAGKGYKKDFAREGTRAPDDWGDCCSGGN